MKFKLAPWICFLIIVRLISAWTHMTYAHPDEWFKTIEFAKVLTTGLATYCQEAALHYTNLLWPFLLTIPLKLAQWLAPQSLQFRVFAFQFFSGVLDLGMFWAWWVLLSAQVATLKLTSRELKWGVALFALPYFLVHDSIRPSSEHLSAIALWISLALLVRKKPALSGFFAVAIFALRYPGALFSTGIGLAVLVRAFKTKDKTEILHFALGCLLGIVICGIPDWIVYGRPWESFWMYLQYNLFTGMSTATFGAQPPQVYLSFFTWRWFRFVAPLGVFLLAFGIPGLVRGLRKCEPWAFAFALFLLGHVLVKHKESRFLAPLELLFFWAAYSQWMVWLAEKRLQKFSRWRRPLKWIVVLTLTANAAVFLKELRGDFWLTPGTYLELPRHLKDHPETCGVISVRHMTSVLLPDQPPIGFTLPELGMPLIWRDRAPPCKTDDTILVHWDRPDPAWLVQRCQLEPSGFLTVLARDNWDWAILSHWVSGPWYACPTSILSFFSTVTVEKTVFSGFKKHENLPPLGATADDVNAFDRNETPEPHCQWLCPG